MLNFPVPYPEELIYSTVARAGIRFGITSPKQLLDAAFDNRKVIATVDLPSHLRAISRHYPRSLKLTAEEIAYKHTLLPIYAPFVPEARRQRCLQWMTSTSKGAAHLALGVAAFRIKPRRYFRLCPMCLHEQFERYGEHYWERFWQVAGCESCPKHGLLLRTTHKLRNYHRHEFIPLTHKPTKKPAQNKATGRKRIESRVLELLTLSPSASPSFVQWGALYKSLAHDAGIIRDGKLMFDLFKHRIQHNWSAKHLQRLGILIDDSPCSWLRMIMRKHRKSFNYLEHIVVLEALQEAEWSFAEILSRAKKQVRHFRTISPPAKQPLSQKELAPKRKAWLALLKKYGTKQGRLSGGAALYTWLYRHDRNWLLKTNAKYRKPILSKWQRLDWHARDQDVLERLKGIKNSYSDSLEGPRRSCNWYFDQVQCRSYAKKISKLPLSQQFLEKNSEDVATYQIRRILLAVQKHNSGQERLAYTQLLRAAGLSEARMHEPTRLFLRSIGYLSWLIFVF